MYIWKQVSADISPDRYVGPINETWHLPPLLDINEVSQRFAESASNLRRRFANLVGMLPYSQETFAKSTWFVSIGIARFYDTLVYKQLHILTKTLSNEKFLGFKQRKM